jgi:hypothetical protein
MGYFLIDGGAASSNFDRNSLLLLVRIVQKFAIPVFYAYPTRRITGLGFSIFVEDFHSSIWVFTSLGGR